MKFTILDIKYSLVLLSVLIFFGSGLQNEFVFQNQNPVCVKEYLFYSPLFS